MTAWITELGEANRRRDVGDVEARFPAMIAATRAIAATNATARRKLSALFDAEGLSSRAIAPILGVGRRTVDRDVKALTAQVGHDDPPAAPKVGKDGKSYTRDRKPPAPKALTTGSNAADHPQPQVESAPTTPPNTDRGMDPVDEMIAADPGAFIDTSAPADPEGDALLARAADLALHTLPLEPDPDDVDDLCAQLCALVTERAATRAAHPAA